MSHSETTKSDPISETTDPLPGEPHHTQCPVFSGRWCYREACDSDLRCIEFRRTTLLFTNDGRPDQTTEWPISRITVWHPSGPLTGEWHPLNELQFAMSFYQAKGYRVTVEHRDDAR